MMFWCNYHPNQQTSSTNISTSILISILYLISLIHWPHNNKRSKGRGRPYVYPPTVILRCFIYVYGSDWIPTDHCMSI